LFEYPFSFLIFVAMRFILHFLTFALVSNLAIAQITLSSSHLDFGKKQTTTMDSLPLTITNSGVSDYSFTNILIVPRFAYFRQDSQFSIHQVSKYITIKSGQSITMYVRFKPLQNIRYKTQLLFVSDKVPGCFAVTLTGEGRYAETYYDSTFDKYDEDLKTALKTLLAKGYINLGYNGARDAMYASIDNIGGQVECVYTGRKATFNTRSGATSNNFNCEHTFPQGFFGQSEPMRADIHHLFSTDETANNKRDNDQFGYVSSPTWSVGGSKWANSVFEPRNEQKGATARAMLYFVLRYQDYTNFLAPQEVLLRNWHKQYPPNTRDITRNTAIFNVQKNRNPLVDHPEMEERISSFTSNKVKSSVSNPELVTKVIDFGKLTANDSAEYTNILLEKGNLQSLIDLSGYSKPWFNLKLSATSISGGEASTLSIKVRGSKLPTNFISDSLDIKIGSQVFKFIYKASIGAATKLTQSKLTGIYLTNPIQHNLHFSEDLSIDTELSLLDAFGRLMFFTEINSQLNDIEIPMLKTGCYFVVLKHNNQLNHLKIFITP
jgi:hypothetical protein